MEDIDILYAYLKAFLITTALLCLLMIASCDKVFAQEVDLSIIAQIESSNNPLAYNKRTQATGLYQITPICLKDYNSYHKGMEYALNEMFEPSKGYSVALWYLETRIPQLLKHYGKPDTLETRLISYNCGIGCIDKPLPVETKNYIIKYHKLERN
jgi:hypothetical protein